MLSRAPMPCVTELPTSSSTDRRGGSFTVLFLTSVPCPSRIAKYPSYHIYPNSCIIVPSINQTTPRSGKGPDRNSIFSSVTDIRLPDFLKAGVKQQHPVNLLHEHLLLPLLAVSAPVCFIDSPSPLRLPTRPSSVFRTEKSQSHRFPQIDEAGNILP